MVVTSPSSSSTVMAFPCLLISLVPSLSSPTTTGGGGAGGSCDVLMPRDFLPGSVCSLPPPSLLLCSLLPQDLLLVGCAESGLLRGLFWWGGGSVSRHGCISAWWVCTVYLHVCPSVRMGKEPYVCTCALVCSRDWWTGFTCCLAVSSLQLLCRRSRCVPVVVVCLVVLFSRTSKTDRCLSDMVWPDLYTFSDLVHLPVFFLPDFSGNIYFFQSFNKPVKKLIDAFEITYDGQVCREGGGDLFLMWKYSYLPHTPGFVLK